MKKFTMLLVAFLLVFTMSGCSHKEKRYSPAEVFQKAKNKESFLMVASATTCGYCREFKEEVIEYRKMNPKADIVFVEVDKIALYKERVNFINHFLVKSTPTLYFVHKGEIVKIVEGGISADQLNELYPKHVEKGEKAEIGN